MRFEMTINQISVFLENRTGQLAQICTTLAASDISIVTLSLADTTDFGIVRMIVAVHEKATPIDMISPMYCTAAKVR